METPPAISDGGIYVRALEYGLTYVPETHYEWAQITIGCHKCSDDKLAKPVFNYYSGIIVMVCSQAEKKEGIEENDSCGLGQIYQWQGLIESQMQLVCTSCGELIPNCLACDSSISCLMCKRGYLASAIIDSFGEARVICIKDFCGFYGEGTGCQGKV